MRQAIAAAVIAVGLGGAALAQDAVSYTTTESFDDVVFALESAIIGKGLVIDSVSHVGDMLERTKGDVGGGETIFTKADIFSFCSATLSREVMEADFANLQFCPYGIFVYARPDMAGETVVGYRAFPDGPMQKVQALLDSIAREAAGIE